jgi:hypothetical protein
MSSTPWLGEDEIIVWGPDPVLPGTSWWWLLVPGPHTNTPVAILQDLGAGAAVLGPLLLAVRPAGAWLLPLSATGTMTLTLYAARLLALAAMLHYEVPLLWFLIHIGGRGAVRGRPAPLLRPRPAGATGSPGRVRRPRPVPGRRPPPGGPLSRD